MATFIQRIERIGKFIRSCVNGIAGMTLHFIYRCLDVSTRLALLGGLSPFLIVRHFIAKYENRRKDSQSRLNAFFSTVFAAPLALPFKLLLNGFLILSVMIYSLLLSPRSGFIMGYKQGFSSVINHVKGNPFKKISALCRLFFSLTEPGIDGLSWTDSLLIRTHSIHPKYIRLKKTPVFRHSLETFINSGAIASQINPDDLLTDQENEASVALTSNHELQALLSEYNQTIEQNACCISLKTIEDTTFKAITVELEHISAHTGNVMKTSNVYHAPDLIRWLDKTPQFTTPDRLSFIMTRHTLNDEKTQLTGINIDQKEITLYLGTPLELNEKIAALAATIRAHLNNTPLPNASRKQSTTSITRTLHSNSLQLENTPASLATQNDTHLTLHVSFNAPSTHEEKQQNDDIITETEPLIPTRKRSSL